MKKILIGLIIFVSLFSLDSSASLFPMVTSVTMISENSVGSPGRPWDTKCTWTLVDIGSQGDQIVPSGKEVVFSAFDNDPSLGFFELSDRAMKGDGVKTLSQIGVTLYNAGPCPKFTDMARAPDDPICEGMGVHTTGVTSFSAFSFPSQCVAPQPVNYSCMFVSANVLLDHGDVPLNEVEGNTATSVQQVYCDTEATVSFRLTSGDQFIPLKHSGKAEILINNTPVNTLNLTLPAGSSTINISDSLTGITDEGSYSGSASLIMTMD